MTPKQQEFITTVQTGVIINAINMSLDQDAALKRRHLVSWTGNSVVIHEMYWAVERIPEDMPAQDAAHDFLSYMLENLRSEGAACPPWFVRS